MFVIVHIVQNIQYSVGFVSVLGAKHILSQRTSHRQDTQKSMTLTRFVVNKQHFNELRRVNKLYVMNI